MNLISLEETGAALIGAGLVKLNEDLKIALILIGVGVLIKIAKVVLNKYGFPVAGKKR